MFINAGGAYEWQAEEMPLPITEEPDEDLEIIKAELGEYYKDSILKSIKSLIELSTGKVPKASSFSFNEDLDFIPEGEGEHISFDSLSFRNEFGAGLGLTPVIEVTEQDESLEKTNGNIQREFELLKTELARKINKIQEQKRDIERHEEQSFVLKAQLRESDEKLQKAQSVDLRYLKNLFQSLLKGIPPLAQEFEQIIKIFYGILGFSSVEENSISMERKGKRGKYDLRLFR